MERFFSNSTPSRETATERAKKVRADAIGCGPAKQARMRGLMVGSRRHQQDHVVALEQSGVRPVLDSSFLLDQLADAFRYQASGVHFGKVAVEW